MRDVVFGAAIRAERVRRRWRQQDLADRASVSRTTVSRIETGRLDEVQLRVARKVCDPLEIRVELLARGRGADLDRLINARHSALHESVARMLERDFPDWVQAPEVSFNVFGERGVIDLAVWHPGRRALLLIEFKTELVDHGVLLATTDRRRRLAAGIVRTKGWSPLTVSTWVVVARSRTNQRRIAAHRTMLRSALPATEREVMAWLRDPEGQVDALSMWTVDRETRTAPTMRVRV
jgi:transcriptional regulator with XRE-family HTH domain